MKQITKFLFLFLIISCNTQTELTATQVLEKSIAFHDPNGNWDTFNGTLFVTMQTPKKSDRKSEITIDLANEYFYVKATRDTVTTTYTVEKDTCLIAFNRTINPSKAIKEKHGLSCERAKMYQNYYTYLYGLPMKLKDKGTILYPKVIKKTFQGKEYLVVKASYSEEIGSDTWYFYFNPKTYAMEVYQFFKDKAKNDGEYILLTDTEIINDIKMPKNRAWYYNKNDEYLGTDRLSKEE